MTHPTVAVILGYRLPFFTRPYSRNTKSPKKVITVPNQSFLLIYTFRLCDRLVILLYSNPINQPPSVGISNLNRLPKCSNMLCNCIQAVHCNVLFSSSPCTCFQRFASKNSICKWANCNSQFIFHSRIWNITRRYSEAGKVLCLVLSLFNRPLNLIVCFLKNTILKYNCKEKMK